VRHVNYILVGNISADSRPEAVLAQRLRAFRDARGWTQDDLVRRMGGAGFSWRQSTVAKTEAATRPVRVDEAAALAAIFGVTVDDLVRTELHPLTARIQLTAAALAEATRELAQRERERDTAEWRCREAQSRLEALEEFAEAAFADRSRDRWVAALIRVIEEFEPDEQQAILQEVGISKDALRSATVDAVSSERTPNEDRDITILVAQRLPMPATTGD
jgi:transcriptional regulator with XRE-family HTH domain